MLAENSLNQTYFERDFKTYLPVFKRFPIVFEKGSGTFLWDADGKKYLDFLSGIAVNNLGHSHPKIVGAIKEQAEKLLHISNFFMSKPQIKLSEKLIQKSKKDRVFFTNSGAESVEAAIKMSRKYAHSTGRGGEIISFSGSFHGRTLATIATGKKEMQKGFQPIPKGFKQLPFNQIENLEQEISKETAAIIVEPIQGEGGVNVANQEFLTGLRNLCNKHDIILIFDEIQCGIGRTGKMFAFEHYNIQPDVITLAKALGGGTPMGATIFDEKIAEATNFGDHGTTFGGNPLVCSVGLAVLEVIEEEKLLEQAVEKGDWLVSKIKEIKDSRITDIRGKGLMIGIEFSFNTKNFVMELLKQGIIANSTANNVLRLLPPLNVSYKELETFIKTLKSVLKTISNDK